MTTKAASEIRAALKAAHGWTSKQVSVRNESYSMGSSVHVVIKDAEVALREVSRIATAHENIYRDDSGEILSGGNSYVHVSYAHGVLEPFVPFVFELLAQEKTTWAFGQFTIGHNTDGWWLW